VPGIWADATGVDTYSKLRECPVTTGTAVAGAETAAGRVAALETAFENFVYGSDKAVSATLAFSAAGKVTVTTTGPLTYAITKVSAALQQWLILLLSPEPPPAPVATPPPPTHPLTDLRLPRCAPPAAVYHQCLRH
jgi:hypothetical protein